jgi:hypothetical protein
LRRDIVVRKKNNNNNMSCHGKHRNGRTEISLPKGGETENTETCKRCRMEREKGKKQ